MRVIVLGGGAVGSVLCKLLVQDSRISEVICCDLKAREFKNKRIKFSKIDISKKSELVKFLKGKKADVAINCVLPTLNTLILESCLESKTNYIDTAAFWAEDKNKNAKLPYKFEQLDFYSRFKKAGIIGLFDAGVAPGLDNILAKEAAVNLDNLENIRIRLIEDTQTKEILFSWSKEWLLDEVNTLPLIYRNGKFKITEAFGEPEEYTFPKPFGKKEVFLLAQDEVGSIPLYLKVKNVDLKAYDNQGEAVAFMYKLGLTSNKEIKVGGNKIRPVDFLCKVLPDVPSSFTDKKFENAYFVLVLEADGKRGGKNITRYYAAVFPKQKEINKLNLGASFISYPTALMIKLFTMVIPRIKEGGIFPPEVLEPELIKDILQELKKHCTFIEKTY